MKYLIIIALLISTSVKGQMLLHLAHKKSVLNFTLSVDSAGYNFAAFSWTPISDNYLIEQSADSINYTGVIYVNADNYTKRQLSAETDYYYRVKSVSNNRLRYTSNVIKVTTAQRTISPQQLFYSTALLYNSQTLNF